MPLLSDISEFEVYAGSLAAPLTKRPGSFDAAQKAAMQRVTDATGYAIPDDASTAAEWAKWCCSVLMMHTLIGTVGQIAEHQLEAVQSEYEAVMEYMDRKKVSLQSQQTTARSQALKSEGDYLW